MRPLGPSTHLMPVSLLEQTNLGLRVGSSLRITLSERPPVQHGPALRTQGHEHHTEEAGMKRVAERFRLFRATF